MGSDTFLFYLITVFHLALIPGPSWMTTLVAARARHAGSAALSVIGVAAANIVFICVSGLLKLVGVIFPPPAQLVAGLLGSATLMWLAIGMVLAPPPMWFGPPAQELPPRSPFIASAAIHLINPNSWVFYISIFWSATHVGPDYWMQVTLLGAVAVIADFVFMSLLAIAVYYCATAMPGMQGRYPRIAAAVGMAYLAISHAVREIERA